MDRMSPHGSYRSDCNSHLYLGSSDDEVDVSESDTQLLIEPESTSEKKSSPREVIKGISRRMSRIYSSTDEASSVKRYQTLSNGKAENLNGDKPAFETARVRSNSYSGFDLSSRSIGFETPKIIIQTSDSTSSLNRPIGSLSDGMVPSDYIGCGQPRHNDSLTLGRVSGSIPSIEAGKAEGDITTTPKKGFKIDLTSLKGGTVEGRRGKSHSIGSLDREQVKLSLYSPQLSSRRAYIPLSTDQRDTKIDIFALKKVSGSEAVKLDKIAEKKIRTAWEIGNPPIITAEKIQQAIQRACQEEIGKLFYSTNGELLSAKELCITESPRRKQLLCLIQKSGLPLVGLIKGLEILLAEVKTILSSEPFLKTEFLELLFEQLEKLTARDKFDIDIDGVHEGKDISAFIGLMDVIVASKDKQQKRVKKLVLLPFGDKQKNYKEIMGVLKKWDDPEESMLGALKDDIHTLSWDNLKILMIPSTIHEWKQKKNTIDIFHNISTSSLIYNLKGESTPIFNTIMINGKAIDNIQELAGISQEKRDPSIRFFGQIFNALYGGFGTPGGDSETSMKQNYECYQRAILQEQSRFMSREFESSTIVDDEIIIPALKILKFASPSCWKIAELFIRSHYHSLFQGQGEKLFKIGLEKIDSKEISSTQQEEMKLDITATSIENFYVTFNKTYCVYPNEPHPIRKLATIPFSWRMDFDHKWWNGKLRITEAYRIEDAATDIERSAILNALINYREAEFTLPSLQMLHMNHNLLPGIESEFWSL